MSLIEAQAISRIYKTGDVEVAALRDVTLSIAAREFVAFVGPSGNANSSGRVLINSDGMGRKRTNALRWTAVPMLMQQTGTSPALKPHKL